MEPIAYIISLFYSLVAYSYFLLSRGNVFDLGPMQEYWTNRFKVRRLGPAAHAGSLCDTRSYFLTSVHTCCPACPAEA